MKKSSRPSGQTTLFQSWNKQTSKRPKTNAKSLFQTWENPRENQTEIPIPSVFSNEQPPASRNETNLEDIINMDDDEDDNELLDVVDKMDCCHTGNLSFSARSCADEDNTANEIIPGFDCSTGNSWIYPTNYPVRDYQFNIVEQALYQNTLVTLPTGLGKTFIAAVVMYNFYRWYPQGKLVFMAPTKPLVAQQIDACYNIMGIPQQDTAEMTGNMAPTKRELLWKQKRVFFLTPQVFQNDLSRGSCRADDVVCLVIDEAHKALGNHAYCQVVRDVLNYNSNFRVLALSATPGDGIKAVQQVITNLLVSHIELRSEDSADIKPYTHQRQVEKIVVKLGDELEFFKTKFLRVLNVVVSRLARNQVIWNRDAEKLSKYMLLMSREQFRKKCASGQQQQPHNQIGSIEGDFAVGISFYHAYELLLQHGLLSFYNFMKGVVDGTKGSSRAKTELTRSPDFVAIMEDLREQIELPPDESHGNVTMFSKVSPTERSSHNGAKSNPSFVGHPKLLKLKDIVLEHFRACETSNHVQSNTGSRVMIFSQFRDSVQEIASMFSAHKPLVRVMSFIGQQSKGTTSKGLTQKEQLEVIRQFRNGGYNTLVATCVGEEGLDIGEVDLIICFDASASPIRLVQRMGRTGRKRAGRIVVLVTEGKEEQIYQRSQRNKSNIHKTILEAARTLDLYLDNPRMVPKNINPVCQKMFITVENKSPKKSKAGKPARKSSDSNIKKLLTSRVTARKEDGFLSPQELSYWHENFKLPHHEAGLTPSRSITTQLRARESGGQQQTEHALSLTEWTAWQTTLQPVSFVGHSKRAKHFTEILEFCDFRRDCGENDDLYDLEMQSFLNSEDIMKPGDKPAREAHQGAGTSDCSVEPGTYGKNGQEKQNKKKRKKEIVISDDEDGTRGQGEGCTRGKTKTQRTIWDYQDIVQPGDEPVCQTHQGTGTDTNGKSAQQKKNGKKRKKEMISDHENDSEDEEKARTKRTIGDLREPDGKLSVTKKSARKSSAESKVKNPSKKRISIDFEFPDDDFEDVPFSSTRVEDKVKKDGASPPERQRKVSVSREVRPKSRGGCDSEDSRSEHDLSKLLDLPSSQRPRDLDRGPASDVLPDAPSLDSLLGLSSFNAGHCSQENTGDCSQENPGDCSQENSSPLNERKDAVHEDQDPTVFPRVAAETPKTSKLHRNNPERTEFTHGPRKTRSFRGELFGRSSDETTDEEEWGFWDMQDLGGYPDIPDEQGESEKRGIAASHKNSGESGTPWKTPRKSLEERGSSHNTKSTNFVSEIPRSEDAESRIKEDNPGGGGLTVFGSGLVCDVETPSKEDDGIEFGFDQEFGNSFFDDDNGLNDFRTPSLFDDFDCEETSNTKVNAVKACTYDDTTCKAVNEIKDFTDKDGTDGELVAVRNTNGRGRNLGRSNSNKEVANKNAAIERSCALKILSARNGTNIAPQGTKRSASENHANGKIDVVKADTDKKVIVKRGTCSHILSKKNPSDREATTLEALARNDATNTELASVEDLVGTDNWEPLVRRLEAASKSFAAEGVDNDRTDAVGCTSRSKKPFQNLIQTNGSGEMIQDAVSKQPSVVDRSLTKIQSFSFGKTRDERTQLPRDHTSELRDSAHDDELYSLDHEDSDIVAPSPRRGDLHRSFFVSLKDDRNNIRNIGSKETALGKKLSPGPVKKNRLKLRCKAKDSSEIKSSQGFCNDAGDVGSSNSKLHSERSLNSQSREIEDKKLKTSPLYPPITTNSSFSFNETSSYTNVCLQAAKSSEGFCNQAVKGHHSLSNSSSQLKALRDHGKLNDDHGSTDSEPERENASQYEKDSPFVIKRSKKKNSKAFGGKVLDSEEETEGEDDNEQNNFKNDQSLVFKGKFSKRTSFGEFGNQVEQLLAPVSDDDEFEAEERTTCNRKRKVPAHRERNISKKSKQEKRRPVVSEFFEEEAEVSDDVDGFDSPGEEPDVSDDVFDESFIDDRTQLTQRSPIVMEREKNKKETVHMMDIYRTSLLTPNRAQLRFRTPAFHRSKNRYKMVYNKGRPAPSSSSSQTDVDEHDVSEVVEDSCESDEADVSEHDEEVRAMSVSPDESQIVVRKNRPGRKRVLSESPETSTTGTENQTGKTRSREPVFASPRDPPVAMRNLEAGHPRHGLSRISKNSNEQLLATGDKNFRPGSVSSLTARDSRVGLQNSHAGRFSLSKNSIESFSETGDRMFKRPDERISKHVNSVVRGKTQYPTGFGDNEEIDEILAALNDSDESLMMEIGAMPTWSTGSGNTTSTSNNYASNTSKTKFSSNQSEQRETTWNVPSKQYRTFGHLESGVKSSRLMGNTTLSSDSYASNITKTQSPTNQSEQREITWNDSSKQDRTFGHLESGVKSSRLMRNTTLSSDSYASNTSKTKFSSNQSEQREFTWNNSSKQERTFEHLKSGEKNNCLNSRSYTKLHSSSPNGQHGSRIDPYPKGIRNTRTIVLPHRNVSSDMITDIQEPVQRGEQAKVSNTKPCVETSFRENGIRKDLSANPKSKLFSSYNQNMVKSCNSESGGKELKTSPLFLNADSSCSSRKRLDSSGNVIRDAIAEPSTSFEKTIIVDSPDAKRDGGPTAITSPALTAAQRDKNKLTILVGSKELSNCQIVSFLRRKHNIKAVVCQITGCDYIVSNRMGVERRLVSDISNPTNINKLTERVRELCDLYDRPCLVIEKDRLKQGETENKSEVRSKYFDRVLACLAQTHVKVLFSDSQEGTSNILALLAQVEAKKNAAIIYPLPLSKDKEQVVKFLNSIPRTSYITAVSLCYHNRTLRDLFNSSAEDLVKRTKNLSLTRAKDIVKFLQHGFCIDMVSSGNT